MTDHKNKSVPSQLSDLFEEALNEAFDEVRDLATLEIKKRVEQVEVPANEPRSADTEAGGDDWIEIGSLSQLRSALGGRFDLLKKRWVGAGFPLKESKSDKGKKYDVDQEGWAELEKWINKQGFEAEVDEDSKSDVRFRIRANQ